VSFPASPSNNEQTTINGVVYQYASATNSWKKLPTALSTLSDVDTTTAPTAGQALVWNATSGKWVAGDVAAGPGTGGIGLDSITLLQSGNLTALAGTVRWYAPYNLDVVSIKTRLRTAADGNISIQINKNGALAVNLSIPANSTSGTEYTTPLSMLEDDYLTVDVITVGSSSVPGVDLYVTFKYQSG
jgi:hypothetical protein